MRTAGTHWLRNAAKTRAHSRPAHRGCEVRRWVTGHLEKGGQFNVEQTELSANQWEVDAFISKWEPITSLLEKVDYLLSLRFLFQPLDGSLADEIGAQHKHEVPG